MSEADKELLDFLKPLDGLYHRNQKPKSWHYHGPTDLLMKEGRFYKPQPAKYWHNSEPNACFRNAAMYAMLHGLRYVEGYATAVIPVHHAWCADAAGNVIEVTWKESGIAYYGVEFPPIKVTRGAVLFNHTNRSVYRKKLKGAKC